MSVLGLVILVSLVVLTIRVEYRRTQCLTPLSFIAVGNLMYMGAVPALYSYSPEDALIFETYVHDAGLTVSEAGLTRVLVAAALFQLVCLVVSLTFVTPRSSIRPDIITDQDILKAAIRWGWVLIGVGLLGVVWMGIKYNGNPFGLYQIAYLERGELLRIHNVQAFLLTIGLYGAAQLIAVYLLAQKMNRAVLLLLAVTLHGLGMKSKFPIFWVVFVFVVVAVSQRGKVLRRLLPICASVAVLSTMSVVRGVERLSDLPEYIAIYWDIIRDAAIKPWDNDLPGPVSIVYFVLNYDVSSYSMKPVTEVLWLLVPRFVYDRGPVLSDVWAEKMIGASYEPGLGFGWSPICDGYLLGGWIGIAFVALLFALLAKHINRLSTTATNYREFFVVVAFCSAPFFLFGVRESTGGMIKQLLISTVLVWLPTFYLATSSRQKVRLAATSGAGRDGG